MARTISDAIRILKSNLEITGLQKSTVSTRQANVRSALASELNVLDDFLTGSYSRHTMIAPLKEADIDIFIVLNSEYYHHYNGKNGGQAGLLDLVKRALRRTYTLTPDISRNGQAVTIQFTDFLVDVVPGFNRSGGGFLIPNSITQSWLSTDPKEHVEMLSTANKWHNGDLVPLIKMLKAWNKQINNNFRSFHLEVLAMQLLKSVTISDYPSGIRYYFDKGRDYIAKENPDPAGYGSDVGSYLNSKQKVDNAVGIFNTAYKRALKAEESVGKGHLMEAFRLYNLIFGRYFPSYR